MLPSTNKTLQVKHNNSRAFHSPNGFHLKGHLILQIVLHPLLLLIQYSTNLTKLHAVDLDSNMIKHSALVINDGNHGFGDAVDHLH
ncbi:MAG: hypothetical protein WAM14_07635 [Candidatus Nitrosopolaris sp.]